MDSYGIKISRDGFDVNSASDKELSVTSRYQTFTVFASGTQDITVTAGQFRNGVTIPHNLGYVPAVQVFSKDSTVDSFVNCPDDLGETFCWIDDTNLYLEIQPTGSRPRTFNFKYYIFNNKIE